MKFLRFLLFPLSILYDLITKIRNLLFDFGVLKSTYFSLPVIVVGNLSVGGTGKTPQIEYLIRLLKDKYNIAVLSRGYKRKTTGFLIVNNSHSALHVGDEPLQYFKKFKNITVAVNEKRKQGIEELISQKSPKVILLDDAFQHRAVKGSFYILLTKYDDLFTDDFLLPTGNLRESRVGAERTDIIIVTKCPLNLNQDQKEIILAKFNKYKKDVFFTNISYADKISGQYQFSLEELKDFEILLITGIANPSPLLRFLKDQQISFRHLKYPDHHQFSKKEITRINHDFDAIKSNKKLILTTEKDYTRLSGELKELCYLEIGIRFFDDKEVVFNKMIMSHIDAYSV